MIVVGMPWSLRMLDMKTCATLDAEKGWAKEMKWPYFVKRSIDMADQTRARAIVNWVEP
jgi:hypothetical protein